MKNTHLYFYMDTEDPYETISISRTPPNRMAINWINRVHHDGGTPYDYGMEMKKFNGGTIKWVRCGVSPFIRLRGQTKAYWPKFEDDEFELLNPSVQFNWFPGGFSIFSVDKNVGYVSRDTKILRYLIIKDEKGKDWISPDFTIYVPWFYD